MLLNPGTVLADRYEIIEKIGSGGMAMVYRGKDRKLDRYVTVKVLREEYIGDEEFIERFRSEACSAARLSHPNIVRVYDVGEDGDTNFIVMEYIHGDTLKKAIKEKAPFDARSTINVAIQIASALAQAHKAHIVHRDIKPQNILVGTDGIVKVTDFGIARAATASTMTTTANAAGSVHYFSPEQARGGYVDEKSDIYSLGITMFEMITRALPYQGNNSVSIALKHINEELPDIRQYNPNCSMSLEGIIRKATRKKADERYPNIDLLLADLIRARTDATGSFIEPTQPQKKTAEEAVAVAASMATAGAAAGMRMSKRAEAAAGIRAKEDVPTAIETETTEPNEAESLGESLTKTTDLKDLEYIRNNKNSAKMPEVAPLVAAEEDASIQTTEHQEPLVSFEKYGKKLRLSKEDEYEKEYMEAEPVKKSNRPNKVRRNPRKEANYGNEHDRKTEKKVILAAVATAIVLIGIISVFGMKMLGGGGLSSGEKNIAVPTFVGVPLSDAQKAAQEMGLELVEEGQDYSSFYDEGTIITQSVGDGTMVANGTKIGIKLSLGLTSENMPDVMGKTEKAATEQIVSLVGASPQITYEFHEAAEVGVVLEQSPQVGTSITAKTSITLIVSKGENDQNVIVPNVVGSTEASARKDLEAVGLVTGSVSQAESATTEKGKVMTQTLAAGQEVATGSVVNLVVSSGKAEVEETPVTPPPAQGGDIGTPGGTGTTEDPDTSGTTGEDVATTGTKSFTINAPSGVDGDLYVRVVRNDADGPFPVTDETRNVTSFPYSVSVSGRGSGTVSCYINEELQWTQNVNFSE